jgi:hypothetical protein
VPAITRLEELSFELAVHDAAFWDEDSLILLTRDADVWRAELEPRPRATERLFSGQQVLAPLARRFQTLTVRPAQGPCPGLAVCARAGAAVVITHDVVLAGCPVGTPGEPRLWWETWGLYGPHLAFSHDGSRLSVTQDFAVLDTRDPTRAWTQGQGAWAWHPRETRLLVLRTEGSVQWLDFPETGDPVPTPLGTLGHEVEWFVQAAVDPDGGGFVMGSWDTLEWWRLHPLRKVHEAPAGIERIRAMVPGPAGDVFATVGLDGARLWDTAAREPLTGVMENVYSVSFSPSGRRFITRTLLSDPYPVHARLELWQVS